MSNSSMANSSLFHRAPGGPSSRGRSFATCVRLTAMMFSLRRKKTTAPACRKQAHNSLAHDLRPGLCLKPSLPKFSPSYLPPLASPRRARLGP